MTSDAPSPQPASPPPPPPPAPPGTGDSGKASGGMRALGVLIALVLAFGAAVMIAVAIDIGDTSTCDDFASLPVEEQLEDNECFDGSSAQKSISVVLAWGSGIVGAIAVIVALMFAATGTRGPLLARVAGAAVVLGILSILIGSI